VDESDELPTQAGLSARAWYGATLEQFLSEDTLQILGSLSRGSQFADTPPQKEAWREEIRLLQRDLVGLAGSIFLELEIPRMGRRVDAVLLLGAAVVVLEFKVGEETFGRAAIEQVWDYALDLKNFHEASHDASIVPVLVATDAKLAAEVTLQVDADGVRRPLLVSGDGLGRALRAIQEDQRGPAVDALQWAGSAYRPTPTIVEAARALYAQHSVEAIARFDAGTRNLRVTSRRVEELVETARANRQKLICFVTGVPGAGKTLVGLNVATRRNDPDRDSPAVFLSGNGPLVDVLREALTRDEFLRRKSKGERVRKGEVRTSVCAFIQNVHHFRNDAMANPSPPPEHVVIFDEAQRAWNLRKTASFMKRKRGLEGFGQSEPEFLVHCVDRHADWAVVVCLVGGGQEIHDGEAGIGAWLEAFASSFPSWQVHISSQLTDSEYAAGSALEVLQSKQAVFFDDALHLSMSMRSFRAENVSSFVKALLDCEEEEARRAFNQLRERYPIAVTRDLNLARRWIRSHARGSERYGLVASSKAQRLKPHAIDIRVSVDPVHWFLNDRDDTRSSYYLEDAATEFQVQGLELDWACVTWDGDLRFADREWSFHDFRGHRWCRVRNPDNQGYLRNAYRVLLTRARQGMVVFVPHGAPDDPTRLPQFYDPTFEYLRNLGVPVLE
jgi:hypothetical protein